MTSVNFSILVENQRQTRNLEYKDNSKPTQGIDFKNDTFLVAAKNQFNDAEAFELGKSQKLADAKMDASHLDNTFSNLLTQYQTQLLLNQQAKSQSEALATKKDSVLTQLATANESVGKLETQKSTLEGNIANQIKFISSLNAERNAQVSSLRAQQSSAIAQHDGRISAYSNQRANCEQAISSANSNKSNLSTRKTTVSGQISDLEAQIAEAPEEEKAALETQLSDLQKELENIDKQLNDCETQINTANTEITTLDENIATEQNAKDDSIAAIEEQINSVQATFAEKIGNAEAELASMKEELNATTAQLAEAVFTQTGLSLEKASLEKMTKEAQLFESSTKTMLETTTSQMTETDKSREVANEKTDKAQKDYDIAKEATDDKETIYTATEAKVKNEQQQKEREPREFMA